MDPLAQMLISSFHGTIEGEGIGQLILVCRGNILVYSEEVVRVILGLDFP